MTQLTLDKPAMAPIDVAIVNYNTREHLRACLATVQPEAPAKIIVVDNASSDGSVEMVRAEYPNVVLYANDTNPGYGTAANQAIVNCCAKYVLLLNSDTRLQAGALQALSDYLDSHQRAAIVGPRLEYMDGRLQISCRPFPTPLITFLEVSQLTRLIRHIPFLQEHHVLACLHTHARVVPWVKGAALAIRREAFETVGGFDSSFFLYFEETELCYRLSTAGWEIHFAPVTTVLHEANASTKQKRVEMMVQNFVALKQYYQLHHTNVRLAELCVKSVVLFKLIRDIVRVLITIDVGKRARIIETIGAWRRILITDWRD
jgi:GT2 family glycosyltransferase